MAVGSALVWALMQSTVEQEGTAAAPSSLQAPGEPAKSAVADAAWDQLSAIQQQRLAPLKRSWSTLSAQQQEKWRLLVDRFQSRSPHDQRRLAARIAEWARLSPQQRAHARLNFLQLTKRYQSPQRQAQWQAYQQAKPQKVHAAAGDGKPRLVPPAFAQATPGATTVLLSQLIDPTPPITAAVNLEAPPEPQLTGDAGR